MTSMVLNVKEIEDLARFAGFDVRGGSDIDEDTEIRIYDKVGSGLYCKEDNTLTVADHYMCYEGYPEEGCLPLGDYTEEDLDLTKRTLGMVKKRDRTSTSPPRSLESRVSHIESILQRYWEVPFKTPLLGEVMVLANVDKNPLIAEAVRGDPMCSSVMGSQGGYDENEEHF